MTHEHDGREYTDEDDMALWRVEPTVELASGHRVIDMYHPVLGDGAILTPYAARRLARMLEAAATRVEQLNREEEAIVEYQARMAEVWADALACNLIGAFFAQRAAGRGCRFEHVKREETWGYDG